MTSYMSQRSGQRSYIAQPWVFFIENILLNPMLSWPNQYISAYDNFWYDSIWSVNTNIADDEVALLSHRIVQLYSCSVINQFRIFLQIFSVQNTCLKPRRWMKVINKFLYVFSGIFQILHFHGKDYIYILICYLQM